MGPSSLSKQDLRDAYKAALALAMKLTRSKARADDVVQDAMERLLTTRPWDPSKGPLDEHVVGIVRSLLNIAHRSAAPRREARAHEGFHAEVVGRQTESPGHGTLEHAESDARQKDAGTILEKLTSQVAGHPVALGVLRCREDGIERARDMAAALRVPVEEIYRANELLKYHLKLIREAK